MNRLFSSLGHSPDRVDRPADAPAEDHLEQPPWKSNTGVGLRVLGDLLCHHREMELAQKANKICGHLSLKPRPSLSG